MDTVRVTAIDTQLRPIRRGSRIPRDSASGLPTVEIARTEDDHLVTRWPRLIDWLVKWTDSSRTSDKIVGEASWVSFCRAINGPCGGSVRYDSMPYDADRCPADLVTAPMQVSMQDIAAMALMAGMRITNCSIMQNSLSMQGIVGTITSSNHPILGLTIHFTPRDTTGNPNLPRIVPDQTTDWRGIVKYEWLARTWGYCTVAGIFFDELKRRTSRRLDEPWTRYFERLTSSLFSPNTSDSDESSDFGGGLFGRHTSFPRSPRRDLVHKSRDVNRERGGPSSINPDNTDDRLDVSKAKKTSGKKKENLASDETRPARQTQRSNVVLREPQDGTWTILLLYIPTFSES